MTNTIVYLHDDLDGWMSAAIVKRIYPDVEFVKVNYGDCYLENTDLNENVIVIIVDFTFPLEIMKMLCERFNEGNLAGLCWIDHHKSAKEKMPKLWNSKDIDGIREINKGSAALLTWEWFYPHEIIPPAIDFISRYDTWDFGEDEREIKEFIMGLNYLVGNVSPEEYNSRILQQLIDYNEQTYNLADEYGHVLMKATDQRIEKSIADGKEITFHGHKTLLVNSNHDVSLIGEAIYNGDHEIGIIWSVRCDKVIFSLRSKTIDVAKLAEKYGGGGHKGAAGFTYPTRDLVNITGFEILGELFMEEK